MENKLKEIINERGIKIIWLADKVGVTRNTISNIINGNIPKVDLAIKIADALGVTVYDIWKPSK